MWIIWITASIFGTGVFTGIAVRIIWDYLKFRRQLAAIRAKQAEIRRMMEERKELLKHGRIGRGL